MSPSGRGPNFLGQPSPSLRKMRQMGRAELAEHARRLQTEAEHLERRIQRLQQRVPNSSKLSALIVLHERLLALAEEARRRYRLKG